MSSTNYVKGSVVLLPFPFTDLKSNKVRPAVVLGQGPKHQDIFLVPITSQLSGMDLQLMQWRAAGLNVPCGVKAQFATIEKRMVLKTIGRLSASDASLLDQEIKVWLEL